METARSRPLWNVGNRDSPLSTLLLACLVIALSYLAPKLEAALMLHPQKEWPLWPGCALLVSVLLLVPRRIWPILIPAAFAGFVLYDLEAGVPVGSIAWFIPADAVQVLIAVWGLSYSLDRIPRLDSVRAVGKYLFFAALLAPCAAAFLSARGIGGSYWNSWRISFFSDVLAFVTLTPAVLNWVNHGPAWVRKSRAYQVEGLALLIVLTFLAYLTFVVESSSQPALLYSLVPLLLWSALRFGSMGVSTLIVPVTLLSIWGAIHDRGPFIGSGPHSDVPSVQLFLLFAATPFMVLAALVEERKRAEGELRENEERLRLAAQAGRMYAFDWDMATDVIVRSGECAHIFSWMDDPMRDIGQQFVARIHPDDREVYGAPDARLTPRNPAYQTSYRLLPPDGSVIWLEVNGRAFFDGQGRMLRIKGMVADVTARKQTEEALHRREAELAEAQRLARVGSWQWDPDSDTVTWSDELYRISGRDPKLPAVSYKDHPKLYTAESWYRLRRAVEEALRNGTPYELDVEMVRPDGRTRWVIARGEAHRDTTGRIAQLHGTVQDITERRGAEEALRHMSGRLITAHEEERTRIARELHDDLSQRMALLQIGVELFEREEIGLSSKARQKLRNIAEVAKEVSSNIHDLSHQLHPSKLETLGLVASLGGFCREFSEQHHLQLQFVFHNMPEQIPKDLTLCLFRIVQEALRNVVKHSGAAEAEVKLSGQENGIDLCISDSGSGFNPESTTGAASLGLISMRERLRLVGGHMAVESEPSHGTRIHVRVPLATTDAGDTREGKVHKAGV